MIFPTSTKVKHTRTKKIFKCLIHTLSLSIGLGVISGAKIKLRSQSFLKTLPESTSKQWIPITNNGRRNSMQFNNFFDKKFGQKRNGSVRPNRNKMGRFSKSINNH